MTNTPVLRSQIEELAREIEQEHGVDPNEAEMFARLALGLPNMECGAVSPMKSYPGIDEEDGDL